MIRFIYLADEASPEYAQTIKNILDLSDLKICLRFDIDAILDIGLLDEVIGSINDQLNLQPKSTFVLLDMEDSPSCHACHVVEATSQLNCIASISTSV